MTTATSLYPAASRADIDRAVREAQAARAASIRAAGHDLTVAIKRLFAALRPQAAH